MKEETSEFEMQMQKSCMEFHPINFLDEFCYQNLPFFNRFIKIGLKMFKIDAPKIWFRFTFVYFCLIQFIFNGRRFLAKHYKNVIVRKIS